MFEIQLKFKESNQFTIMNVRRLVYLFLEKFFAFVFVDKNKMTLKKKNIKLKTKSFQFYSILDVT